MKAKLHYRVAAEVFDQFPGYVRGVLLAYDVTNRETPSELISLLRDAEASVRSRLAPEMVAEHPHIKCWRDAYRSLGAKPSEFRSSVEAMARRALREQPLPSINALVDIGNMASLRYLVPVGSHAIDVLTQDIALRLATGEETFVPFGSNQAEHPLVGEVVMAEGMTVLTRRWTWRQANHTLTVQDTKAVEYNIDALPPVSRAQVEEIGRNIAGFVEQYCGGRTQLKFLTQDNPELQLFE